MKRMKYIYITLLALIAISCDNFLDELPDNRAEVDSQAKIRRLLVSAYSDENYALPCELSSDNVEDIGEENPYSERIYDQLAYWIDVTEEDNDDLKGVWEGGYKAIAHSNQALAAIEELGEANLLAEKGEALISRAYAHFMLVNIFCKHYTSSGSSSDLGVPYMEAPETTLNPKYERGTVAEVYEKINADIEAALPLISDDIYEVPAYHFTRRAAYAFAARFNLYYEKWDKAAEYATKALGTNPAAVLRDWAALGALPRDPDPVTNAYINDAANMLAIPSVSSVGMYFGAFYTGSRFNHTEYVAKTETLGAPTPWAPEGVDLFDNVFRYRPFVYNATNLNKTLFYKIPYLFEYTDPIAGIGYRHTVMVPFTTDETLLVRAEANIMQGYNNEALADLNMWSKNFYAGMETTLDDITALYSAMDYSTQDVPTQKKKLNPAFTVTEGMQENLIHYVLQCRRILTLHEGLRWFDIKRYGIEVPRRQLQFDGSTRTVPDVLTANDLRKALQIPSDAITAGIEANPR
nr:RagB/SusD family nutrient uptake outer membrane protein [uncultured Draconibacterium sp.]